MKLFDTKLLTSKIILITGLTRCGKTALSPIISSFNNCEQFFFSTISENLSVLNYLKIIKNDIAQNLIRKSINEEIFNKIYGRNLNYKKEDYTSVKKYNGIVKYEKRQNLLKTNINIKKIIHINNFPILFHEGLINLKLLETTFNKPYIINISRHPVELISSWLKKRYFGKYFERLENNIITINYKKKNIPFFLKGVEKKINFCKSPEDYVVLMINNLKNKFKINYKKSKLKKKIILLKFDDLMIDPNRVLKELSCRLKLKSSKNTPRTLRMQKFPRLILYKKRSKTKKSILKNLSKDFRKIFLNMIDEYENNKVSF